MESLFFVKARGEELGPLTLGQLRSMWQRGEITVETPFRHEGQDAWQTLAIMRSDLEAAAMAVSQGPPPLPAEQQASAKSPRKASDVAGCGCLIIMVIGIGLLVATSKPEQAPEANAASVKANQTSQSAENAPSLPVPRNDSPPAVKNAAALENAVPPKPQRTITFEEIDEFFFGSDTNTELQKAEKWKEYKGKPIRWTGKVASISEGLFGGLSVHVKMKRTTLISDVMIRVDGSQREKALRFKEGDEITFSGKLSDWGQIIGISITEGLIE